MIKIKDSTEALEKFEEAATRHADATEQGDYQTANKNYAVIVKAVEFLREQNEIEKLSGILNHNNVGVRLWAATYLLPVSEHEGLRVLKQLAGETGIFSFDAQMTIREWEKGTLSL